MLIRDLRLAVRQSHKNPGFALAVVMTLALGIGVNTAVFSLVNGFLLRPLPYPEPDRLGVLLLHREGTPPSSGQYVTEEDDSHDGNTWNWIRDNVPAVREASYGLASGVNLQSGSGTGASARYAHAMRVSAHYFDVLGVPLFLGREFTEEEDRQGGAPVAILSYSLWHTAFQDDREITGKLIQLKGEPYTVVGVLPPYAQTPQTADVWTPLQPAPSGECGGTNCGIILRLAPGASWQQAEAEISHLRKPFFDTVEQKYKGRVFFHAVPFQRTMGVGAEDRRTPVLVLMLAVSFILLIACANLAGLTLVRIARRTPEIATRLSLGATRWMILKQLWLESLVLALLGAGSGLVLALGILKFLSGFLPLQYMPLGGIDIDLRVLGFTVAASIFTSMLFGALPALQTRRVDLRSAMALGSHSVARGSSRLRQMLIAGEVALTVVLLAGAGLLIRTLVYLETLPPGFDATNVITAKVSLDDARYHNADKFHELLKKSLTAMKQIPGVEDAAVGLSVPYERGLQVGVRMLDGKARVDDPDYGAGTAYVTPGYFKTLHIPLVLGRAIEDSDTAATEPVAVVNAEFVRQYYAQADPIGLHIKSNGVTYRIVGVLGNVAKTPVNAQAPMAIEPDFYVPSTQMNQGLVNMAHVWNQPSWIVRTSKPLVGITGAMQKALAQADPSLPFSGFYSMKDILAENLIIQRAQVMLLGVLAGLALLLSAVGIYGLVSNLVVQRTREIGIRLALGAQMRQVMMDVGRSGVVASAVGLVVGMGLAFFAVRVLRSQLYGVRAYDPVTLTVVPFVLATIALAASFLPTLRIARIDPAETLRME